jgi:NAD(P)-dependent dehydrogenase (short-subunit alcohol dehydrogenase family)
MKRLDGRVAVITAAGSGMGRASAERFAAEGAHVIVADIDEQAATETVEAIGAAGGSATAERVDVGDLDALQVLFDGIEREHGVLHVLFNHAGIPGEAGLDMDVESWQRSVDINLKSAFYASRFALPLLQKAQGKASIIFTASTSGIVGSPYSPLYSMTKGGVVLLMRSLAVRLGPEGIRSNAICPALIETPMLSQFFGREAGADVSDLKANYMSSVPMGRSAQPSEVASVAAFLASDDASFVTGVAVPVDGGFLAK